MESRRPTGLTWLSMTLAGTIGVSLTIAQQPAAPLFRLSSPTGGEAWCVASQHYIAWQALSVGDAATLRLDYSTDGGRNWIAIVSNTPNTGRFLWRVPALISHACRLRAVLSAPGRQVESQASFSIAASREVRDYRWTCVSPQAPFAPRDGAGAVVYRNRMWLLGGWNPADKRHFPRICNNEVWSSADGLHWVLEKPNSFVDQSFNSRADWEGRHTAGYVVYRNRMWIVGGDVNQGHYHSDVWNSADGKTWTLVNPDRPVPWGPRALHQALVFRDRIWVMGGQTLPAFGPAPEVFYRDIWSATDGAHWTPVSAREPYWPARGMIGGAVVLHGRMWILGGGTYDTPQAPRRLFYNDVWSSSDGRRWKRHLECAPWEPRQYHDVAVFDGRMWVMEGWNQKNRNDVWYSDDGVNWYELPGTPWKPRHAASVFVHDNALWMVAGNNMESDVWKLVRTSLR